MSGFWFTLFHVITTGLRLAACYHTYERYTAYLSKPGAFPKHIYSNGGPFKFFTYWTLFIHTLTFGLTLITDYIDSSAIIALRNLLFNGLALPMGLFVSTLFWSVYYYDKRLIRPTDVDDFEPPWKNHVLHTLPIVSILLDMFLVDYKTGHNQCETPLLSVVLVVYTIYSVFIGLRCDDWVYPFMYIDATIYDRIAYIIGSLTLASSYYCLGCIQYKLAWY